MLKWFRAADWSGGPTGPVGRRAETDQYGATAPFTIRTSECVETISKGGVVVSDSGCMYRNYQRTSGNHQRHWQLRETIGVSTSRNIIKISARWETVSRFGWQRAYLNTSTQANVPDTFRIHSCNLRLVFSIPISAFWSHAGTYFLF